MSSRKSVIAVCRCECGLSWSAAGMPAYSAKRRTSRYTYSS
ncbi:hypothetical protein L083_2598 [Actinoplanes sp. N902-109]|nr:hypothetical protein L083_2598 [Actinoplanes sp. N902-109]